MNRREHNFHGIKYYSHIPTLLADIDRDSLMSERVKVLLHDMQLKIAEIDGRLKLCDNTVLRDILLREAEALWQMAEGDGHSLFAFMLNMDPRHEGEVADIIKAIEYGVEALEDLPICCRLMQNLHYIVCGSDRYEKRYPGEFRTSPIWIGESGDTLATATYVPPVDDDMQNGLSDLERFINYDESLPPLVAAALIHYQFQMIHPFVDGNGRVGSILTTLYLMQRGVISSPWFCLSVILQEHYSMYCGALQHLNVAGNFEDWVYFYLRAVQELLRRGVCLEVDIQQ